MTANFAGVPGNLPGLRLATILDLMLARRLTGTARIDIELGADQIDWEPAGLADALGIFVTQDEDGPYVIRSLSGFGPKTVKVIVNDDLTLDLVLKDQDLAGTAEERFNFGGSDLTLAPGEGAALFYDVDQSRWICQDVAQPFPGHQAQYIIAPSLIGQYGSGEPLMRHKFADLVSFTANMVGSMADAGDSSDGTAAFSLQKNGVEFGQITFTSSATGVITSDAVEFSPGDVFEIFAPNPADALLADVSFTLIGSKPFN